ncbi:helix-turn-helix domain-containing protein [Streptomyces sp. NPDC012765]|uniref:helix-turn-helix domain-containing protein n=1 Tax=Streptomyces sp. NPDC012765 TaxID=3155249 RepID=UPI003411323F
MTDPTTDPVARRRARVAQLTRDKRTIRDIAKELEVSKDVVYRDQKWIKRNAPATPAATQHALHRDKAGQAAAALQALHTAITAAADARPAYQILVDDEMAAQWIAQLRDDARRVLDIAETFRDYFPHLTGPTATPDP